MCVHIHIYIHVYTRLCRPSSWTLFKGTGASEISGTSPLWHWSPAPGSGLATTRRFGSTLLELLSCGIGGSGSGAVVVVVVLGVVVAAVAAAGGGGGTCTAFLWRPNMSIKSCSVLPFWFKYILGCTYIYRDHEVAFLAWFGYGCKHAMKLPAGASLRKSPKVGMSVVAFAFCEVCSCHVGEDPQAPD